MFRLKRQEGLGVIDTLIVCIIVAFLMVVFLAHYQQVAQKAQETSLKEGLRNIRVSINVYRAWNRNQNPENLRKLITESYLWPSPSGTLFKRYYLEASSTDSEGHLLDPFGRRYHYEPKTGEVWSGTEGYEKW
ncbi:MAG TPA: type II secretion system protein [Nitrospiria bacterium]|jgi:type II secretory pathway pseudopilin PulG